MMEEKEYESERSARTKKTNTDAKSTAETKPTTDRRSGNKNRPFDPLVRDKLYPDPEKVFNFAPVELRTALQDGVVVVDTNVLLLPYSTGQDSLKQIRLVYGRLAEEKRLRVPGQVAREFANNRAEKLKALFQQIALKQDSNLKLGTYPLLDGMPEYSKVREHEKQISAALEEYRKSVGKLLDRIAGWRWDDPVSAIYRDFFTAEVIVDPPFDRDKTLEELEYRYLHRIPPGYEDSTKDDSGIGDLLIWKTIVKIGENEQKHLIFVTGEQKPDWWYKANHRALYPRFELVDEYRRASSGKSLQLISFADLLKAFSVPEQVLAEVQKEEAVSRFTSARWQGSASRQELSRLLGERAEAAVARWILSIRPEAEIKYGRGDLPDLVVQAKGHLEAYEVKTISNLVNAPRRLREALNRIQSLRSPNVDLNLVIVLQNESDVNAVVESVSQIDFSTRNPRVIVGVIDENEVFRPARVFDPGDLNSWDAGPGGP